MPRKKKLQEVGGLRLVAYYRYSNGGQQTEQSIEGQRRDCEAYAKAHGYKIVHEYIDRHISGKSDSRPAFQQMISDSDSHLFDAVICWKQTASPAAATTPSSTRPACGRTGSRFCMPPRRW